MTRARQHIVSGGRMQQRVEAIADDIQNCHVSRASACSSCRMVLLTRRNAPFIVASTCQSELKRTLRRANPRPKSAPARGFAELAAAHSVQMVNGGFPEPASYGFEKVDATAGCSLSPEPGHQSKIYTESNESDFSLVFGVLGATRTLAIYRRLLVKGSIAGTTATVARRIAGYRGGPQPNQKRRPGSRDVFSASHGILARAGARALAQGEDT